MGENETRVSVLSIRSPFMPQRTSLSTLWPASIEVVVFDFVLPEPLRKATGAGTRFDVEFLPEVFSRRLILSFPFQMSDNCIPPKLGYLGPFAE